MQPWKSTVDDEELRIEAQRLLLEVAQRLREPGAVEAIADLANAQAGNPQRRHWLPESVGSGPLSVALLFAHMDRCFPHDGWASAAHHQLEQAVRRIEAIERFERCADGVITGIAGMCFTTYYMANGTHRYARLLAKLDSLLIERVSRDLGLLDSAGGRISWTDFDLIGGLSGICRYLLLRRHCPEAVAVLHDGLDHLIFLSHRLDSSPGYFTPVELLPTHLHRELYPCGYTDCGLAHGVPGPLATLALATTAGVDRPGQHDSIRHLASWICEQRCDDEWGPNWPMGVGRGQPDKRYPVRSAWCYGPPGVAVALRHAAEALGDGGLRQLSIQAFEAVANRPPQVRGIFSPIICHGVAGVLQATLRCVNSGHVRSRALVVFANRLVQDLVRGFDSDAPLGFRDIDGDLRIDSPAFLDGAAGVVMALLAATSDVEPAWDRLLLLS